MMRPTQDNALRTAVRTILVNLRYRIETEHYDYHTDAVDDARDAMLGEFEKRGYHAGLLESIEQALNSGDGVYRP